MLFSLVHYIIEINDVLLVHTSLFKVAQFYWHKNSSLEQVFSELVRVNPYRSLFTSISHFALFILIFYWFCTQVALSDLLEEQENCFQTISDVTSFLIVKSCTIQSSHWTCQFELMSEFYTRVIFVFLLFTSRTLTFKVVFLTQGQFTSGNILNALVYVAYSQLITCRNCTTWYNELASTTEDSHAIRSTAMVQKVWRPIQTSASS